MDQEFFNLSDLVLNNPDEKPFVDPRVYRITRDANGDASVTLRVLPDKNNVAFMKLFKINPNITQGGIQRFVSITSPQTIGKECPFHRHWQSLWNSGNKEEARKFSRSEKYAMNVMIVNDKNAPENNGKFFVMEFAKTVFNELIEIVKPSDEDVTPKNLFNPVQGNTIKITQETVAGIPRYKKLIILENEKENPFERFNLTSKEDWMKLVEENTYDLEEYKQSIIKPYEELVKDLNFVLFKDVEEGGQNSSGYQGSQTTETASNPEQAIKPAKKARTSKTKENKDSLDDILDSL